MRTRTTLLTAGLASAALVLSACGGGSGGSGGGDGSAEGGGDLGTEFITIATGGSSGVYYQVGAGMSELLADQLGSDTSVQATGASVENITLLTEGGAEVAFAMADATTQALEGAGPFEENGAVDSLPAIASLYDQYLQLITVEGSGIESVEDLAGKRVSVGDINSGVELNARTVVDAYGMSYDDFTADYLSYAEAIDQMKNGQVQAAFVTSGLPNSAVTDLSTTEDVVVVPITGEGRETLLNDYDYFGEGEVPADVYDTAEAAETLTIPNLLLASPELSEDAVYDITKAIFDNIDQVHATHNAAKDITLENATDVTVTDIHPGAQRYYDEAGS
ncbi:TAXI family TRAP transporter solute-binding subunit [Brevibacterium sp. R8603A2]|uniref:TAXI family TRAP transporter solute-binding subunit n=1 Tax=Brevibacterium pityocampae TaxID=506594 RepID=A0ABP8J8J9_9MICO|nr:TAXI family TRAP transporter solute-binding subunit [Brevibacterium sp. R8603A2]MCK1803013.1 TAXI family TRAP transporter solute-binding subunit [Brevibacterium sp. R8603A2]